MCGLLRCNLDIFAWKPANMTGVPSHIAEYMLNIHEGCLPVRQKKRGQAPERNKAIYEEVKKLVDAGIMKEVPYHSWLSNLVMIKKHDGSWRMFHATNNEAEYEALIAGLRIAKQMGVTNIQANVDSKLVANQVNETYVAKELGMIKYLEKVKILASTFKEFSIKQVPRGENKIADALSKMASTSFAHLSKQPPGSPPRTKEPTTETDTHHISMTILQMGIDIARPFSEGAGKVKFLIVAIDYFTKWIEAKPVATITGAQIKKFVWDNIVCRFGLPGEIISDNRKHFRDNPFKDWCERLCIRQCFAFVKHPQANGLVERANRSLGEGIKARLDERIKNWMEEISHVLWAHRTMIKSSNEETPFSLTYRTEVVIPVEIGMPTLRTAKVDMIKNNEALEIN
uniref:Reverse transcriptase domain-containing protein n=1 Tax=Tanacetum cinerariifolium TaxID=118510 RepID=A0A6L2L5A0_TANCI|nr:reverse transcriptase domain-containing protein [Tanacetum cinerariifolium]